MNMARTGAGEEDSGFVGSKEGRKDGKMVGDWRLGQALGSGMSGQYFSLLYVSARTLTRISGRVRIARSTITGQFAAIKLIKKPSEDVKAGTTLSGRSQKTDVRSQKSLREAADREIVILKLVEHPNVLRLLDVYETPDHTYVVALCRLRSWTDRFELQIFGDRVLRWRRAVPIRRRKQAHKASGSSSVQSANRCCTSSNRKVCFSLTFRSTALASSSNVDCSSRHKARKYSRRTSHFGKSFWATRSQTRRFRNGRLSSSWQIPRDVVR